MSSDETAGEGFTGKNPAGDLTSENSAEREAGQTEKTKTKTLRVPVSTYRLQFNRLLPFSRAR
ncbi:MAG: hypothetical protein M0Z75_09555, partial [Nitrospiraceae bacterium]|nr:hypothetical protein [Nitrospiraceae bacterium]